MALRRAISLSSIPSFGIPSASGLQSSGGSSALASQYWAIHTQTLYGDWVRRWVFETEPTLGVQSIPSGCPKIEYTDCDFDYTISVKLVKEFNTYQGEFNQDQQIDYTSDHPEGGLGASGNLWTTKQGYIRMKWDDDTHTEVDCMQSVGGIEGGKMKGEYSFGYPHDLVDTSGNIAGIFIDTLGIAAAATCRQLKLHLINF